MSKRKPSKAMKELEEEKSSFSFTGLIVLISIGYFVYTFTKG
jgi:hypothetical protein